MCLYQLMPGCLPPSRSNCLSWRRLSSKCKEGLGFGVSFHQVSVCWLSITSSSKKSFVPTKGESWFEWCGPQTRGCSQARWQKGGDSAQLPSALDSCPEKAWGARDPPWTSDSVNLGPFGSRQGIQHHSGQWHLSKVWRELLTWEIHVMLPKLLMVNTCVL